MRSGRTRKVIAVAIPLLIGSASLLAQDAPPTATESPPQFTVGEAGQVITTTDDHLTGDDFLTKNKTQPGVIALSDGLQYKVLTKGTGAKPKATDIVTVDYVGTLIDGTEFDSSYKRGQPASFPVNGVIAGWTEALQLMPVGSTWELFIPSDLAYGSEGAPPIIGPNETLIFKVKLIGIQKQG